MANKILLFDDTTWRYANLKSDLLAKYSLQFTIYSEFSENLLLNDISSGVAYIIIHDSFESTVTKNNVETIKAFAQKSNIKYAIFSGGVESDFVNEIEIRLYADSMYYNLRDFLEYYSFNAEIQPEILIYGKEWRRSIALEENVSNEIRKLNNSSVLRNDVYLIEDERARRNKLAKRIGVQSIDVGKEFHDKNLHSISVSIQSITPKPEVIIIPCSLGNIHTNYSGIKLGFHIRLTLSIKELRFIPLIFITEDDAYEILTHLDNNVLPIVKSRNCKLISYSDLKSIEQIIAAFDKPFVLEIEESILREKLLRQVSISPPSNIGNHSLINQWASIKLGSFLGMNTREPYSLYLKYLNAKILNDSISKEVISTVLDKWVKYLSNIRSLKILVLENDNIWHPILKRLFNPRSNPVIQLTFAQNIEVAKNALNSENYNLLLVDLRLTQHDDATSSHYEISNFTGGKFIIEVRKNNPAVSIIAFTASQKGWISEQLKEIGVDSVFYKEAPDVNSNSTFSFHNFRLFLKSIRRCIERESELTFFWNLSSLIKSGIRSSIVNDNIIKRVTEKLDIGFYLLKIQQTKYDSQFTYTEYELAFLTYWSILNEIAADSFTIVDRNMQINSNGHYFLKNNKTEIRSNRSGAPNFIQNKPFYYAIYGVMENASGNFLQSLPAQMAGLIYLKSNKSENIKESWADLLHKMAKFRNGLDYTHSDFSLMKTPGHTIKISRNLNIDERKENCKNMLKLIHILIFDREP